MLILRRKEGQWVEITHRSGDTIRVRVTNIRARGPGQIDLAFDDGERHFAIHRPERCTRLDNPTETATVCLAVESSLPSALDLTGVAV